MIDGPYRGICAPRPPPPEPYKPTGILASIMGTAVMRYKAEMDAAAAAIRARRCACPHCRGCR